MDNIDYEALAKTTKITPMSCQDVVAAYQEQMRARGVVEVRAEDVERALEWRTGNRGYSESNVATKERLEAALAAPEPAREDTSD